jgi:ankyrin repeat protein
MCNSFLASYNRDRLQSFRNIVVEKLSNQHSGCNPRGNGKSPAEEPIKHAQTHNNRSALHQTCSKDKIVVVKELLWQGADPTVVTEGSKGNALHMAVWSGHLDIIRVLLSPDQSPPNVQPAIEGVSKTKMMGSEAVARMGVGKTW